MEFVSNFVMCPIDSYTSINLVYLAVNSGFFCKRHSRARKRLRAIACESPRVLGI